MHFPPLFIEHKAFFEILEVMSIILSGDNINTHINNYNEIFEKEIYPLKFIERKNTYYLLQDNIKFSLSINQKTGNRSHEFSKFSTLGSINTDLNGIIYQNTKGKLDFFDINMPISYFTMLKKTFKKEVLSQHLIFIESKEIKNPYFDINYDNTEYEKHLSYIYKMRKNSNFYVTFFKVNLDSKDYPIGFDCVYLSKIID